MISLRRHNSWPALSWVAQISNLGVIVDCGRGVDEFEDAIFEGAWAGEFHKAGFDEAADVFGSGLKIAGADTIIVPPSHTLEPIFVVRKPKAGIICSNSLPLLCRQSGLLPVARRNLGSLFASIVLGIDRSPVSVPFSGGSQGLLLFHHNLMVSNGGSDVRIQPKTARISFDDFEDYVGHLQQVVAGVCANASSPARHRRYRPVTTISSGYDSPTGAVLARQNGCEVALTIQDDRHGADDSGAAIAECLGLRVVARKRECGDANVQATFLASGMGGEDVTHSVFRDWHAGSVLFTGFHGDKVWSRDAPATRKIKRGDISGSSMGEYRIETDFIHLPVPFIAAQAYPELQRLANSEEMAPFSISGSYDRPIPRRVIEAAGVPRELFGMAKKAVSFTFARGDRRALCAPQEQPGRVALVQRKLYSLGVRYWSKRRRLSGATGFNGMLPTDHLFGGHWEVFEHGHPEEPKWLLWAIETRCRLYGD